MGSARQVRFLLACDPYDISWQHSRHLSLSHGNAPSQHAKLSRCEAPALLCITLPPLYVRYVRICKDPGREDTLCKNTAQQVDPGSRLH